MHLQEIWNQKVKDLMSMCFIEKVWFSKLCRLFKRVSMIQSQSMRGSMMIKVISIHQVDKLTPRFPVQESNRQAKRLWSRTSQTKVKIIKPILTETVVLPHPATVTSISRCCSRTQLSSLKVDLAIFKWELDHQVLRINRRLILSLEPEESIIRILLRTPKKIWMMMKWIYILKTGIRLKPLTIFLKRKRSIMQTMS